MNKILATHTYLKFTDDVNLFNRFQTTVSFCELHLFFSITYFKFKAVWNLCFLPKALSTSYHFHSWLTKPKEASVFCGISSIRFSSVLIWNAFHLIKIMTRIRWVYFSIARLHFPRWHLNFRWLTISSTAWHNTYNNDTQLKLSTGPREIGRERPQREDANVYQATYVSCNQIFVYEI